MKTQKNGRKLLQFQDPGWSLPPPLPKQHEPTITFHNATSSRSPASGIHAPFDSSMGLTILVLLTALFFMGFFSIYIRCFAGNPTAENDSHQTRRSNGQNRSTAPRGWMDSRRGLDPQAIRSLPVYRYGVGAKHRAADDCAICLSEFEEGESVKVMPNCMHVFHVPCVDTWLSSHVSCPVCRNTRLFVDKGGGGLCVMQEMVAQRV